MTRRGFVGALVVGGAAVVAGCSEWFPARYRFRLTVEVDTLQGLRSGSSVMEVASAAATIKLPDSAALSTYMLGEAVAVDLPGGTLFALISNTTSGQTLAAEATMALAPFRRGVPESFLAAVTKLGRRDQRGRTAELRPEAYPKFVRFRDIRDPRSVEGVDASDLANSFGDGVGLSKLTVSITDQEITRALDKRLNWINRVSEYRTDKDNPFTGTLPEIISGLRSPMK